MRRRLAANHLKYERIEQRKSQYIGLALIELSLSTSAKAGESKGDEFNMRV